MQPKGRVEMGENALVSLSYKSLGAQLLDVKWVLTFYNGENFYDKKILPPNPEIRPR